MSRFESKEVRIDAAPEVVSDFLHDPRNLYELLPKDRIEDWEADEDKCSFRISGLSSMDLHRSEALRGEKVAYRSGEQAPFPFLLSVHLEEKDGGTLSQVLFEAEMNAFMEQMAKGPLERLFDHMADRIKELDLKS